MVVQVKQKALNLLFVMLFALAAAGIGVVASNGIMADGQGIQVVCQSGAGGGC